MERVSFSALDLESLYRVIDASINIRKRYQYFLWTQGDLQRLLPHEILVCATGDLVKHDIRIDCFSGAPYGEHLLELLGDPERGLIPRLVSHWRERDCAPLILPDARCDEREHAFLTREIRHLELVNCAAHGVVDYHSGMGAFFAFFRIENGVCRKYRYCLDLLVPHLYMALQRIAIGESPAAAAAPGEGLVLSEREAEILRWMRAGKTNQEIGLILNISPFTVKNHVQKILRKLNVTNRTQAVAKSGQRKKPLESVSR